MHQIWTFIILIFTGNGCSWIKDNSNIHDKTVDRVKNEGPLHSVFSKTPVSVASVENLFEFICTGPLLDKIGLNSDKVAESIDKWLLCGSHLCRLFQLNEMDLNEAQKIRIFHYYIPVFLWCEQEIADHSSKFKDGEEIPPLVVPFLMSKGFDF